MYHHRFAECPPAGICRSPCDRRARFSRVDLGNVADVRRFFHLSLPPPRLLSEATRDLVVTHTDSCRLFTCLIFVVFRRDLYALDDLEPTEAKAPIIIRTQKRPSEAFRFQCRGFPGFIFTRSCFPRSVSIRQRVSPTLAQNGGATTSRHKTSCATVRSIATSPVTTLLGILRQTRVHRPF